MGNSNLAYAWNNDRYEEESKAKREELAQSVISNIMLRRNVIFVVIDNVFNF